MKRIIPIVLTLASFACADPGAEPIEYDLTCKVIDCVNADDTNQYKGSYAQYFDCIWYCKNYKGYDSQYVSLSFVNTDGCWRLDGEFIADGICY